MIAPVAAAAALIATVASASTLGGLQGSPLGAGASPIARCDTAFAFAYTTSGGNVTSVTVSDIADPACEGGELRLTLANAGGVAIASGGPATIPADGDTTPNALAVAVSPTPAAGQVVRAHVSVVGP